MTKLSHSLPLLKNPKVSKKVKDAILILGEDFNHVCWAIRKETGRFMGMFLNDGDIMYLPTDPVKRNALAILNSEFIKENPMPYGEQVEFA